MPRRPRFPPYTPPPLMNLVRLRNPADRPPVQMGRYGQVVLGGRLTWDGDLIRWGGDALRWGTELPTWGVEVFADVRDRAPALRTEEEQTTYEGVTVFTVRERSDIAANVEVVYADEVYESVGPPVVRGGMGRGRLARYLEIHTTRRTAA